MEKNCFVDVLVLNVPSLISKGKQEFLNADALWDFVTSQLPGTVFILTHNYLDDGKF